MSHYLMLAIGFALLLGGGEMLVRGAVSTAERLGVSSLFIGVVIVGFGTSMPEMVTSVEASLSGSPGIAIGNIVGSNIANILLVLGLSALVAPILVHPLAATRDGLFVLGSTLLFVVIGLTLPLDRAAGAGLLLGLALYIGTSYRHEATTGDPQTENSSSSPERNDEFDTRAMSSEVAALAVRQQLAFPLGLTVGGLIILIIGGMLLIDGARGIATEFGVSETVIGLTIVAIGTSLPEIVTCVIAALRRHGDVALGNILGSCVYNLLAIAGVTAIISPTVIPAEIVRFDNFVLLAATVTMLIFLRTGTRIGRVQGAVLCLSYITYLAWLWPN